MFADDTKIWAVIPQIGTSSACSQI